MYDNPLFWEHGLFLQPQHFQLAHRQQLSALTRMASLLNPYLWGVRRLVVNEDALNNGTFEVAQLELLLHSGEWAVLPGNATLPPRSFLAAWTTPEEPLYVSLALAGFRAQGNNVLRTDAPADAPETVRYTAPLAPETIPDLMGDGPEADVGTLRYNLRLCFSPDDCPDLPRLPLARLVRDGERVRLDASFTPPCVDVNAVPELRRLLHDVRDTLLSRSRQLEEYKIIAGDAGVSGVSSLHGITLFSVLGVLSRNAPELEQFLDAPSIHPWPVYRALCRLVGELSVFSATLSALGETPQGTRALPPYDHENLQHCFRAACDIIARLVDTFVIGPAFTFPLETQGRADHLGTVMPQSARTGVYTYWLLVRTSHAEGLAERMERLAKLAPTENLDGIVAQALPGVRLRRSAQPPAGLPLRGDTLYFTIDQNDPLWRKIMQQGNLALMLPSPPEDLSVVLAVIQR
ncbi:MAG: type VI secretion system baseplate subunit TssK [Desulfovibrio sp.]|uniref:type VI secretion system baseplate subunit TssK n=1 Tax=Desulfovibrio sp. TaxID=885 RepID=UPI0025BE5814|nr:type VI secretion system baseplate subunit TssK [Desulfovibrio sp.]MCI7568656.1 type VI secretion system baseplate subunit TssK [Desulfovibrio sp.]